MNSVHRKLGWSVPVAGIIAVPLALFPQRAICAIVGAIDWIAGERLGSVVALANALTLLP
jgi:hypothetical protein